MRHDASSPDKTVDGDGASSSSPSPTGHTKSHAEKEEEGRDDDYDDDARALIRPFQCPRCSRPLTLPVTLPCGRAVCRSCLPATHERAARFSYPDAPDRKRGILCPLAGCRLVHPAAECACVDVTLAKVVDAVAAVVARYTAEALETPTEARVDHDHDRRGEDCQDDDRCDDCQDVDRQEDGQDDDRHQHSLDDDDGTPRTHVLPWSKLPSTYALAARGTLPYDADRTYVSSSTAADVHRAIDRAVWRELREATTRELDCQVCYAVLLDPVTTFCGHTLCRKCMARVLDHSLGCPVCRRDFSAMPAGLDRHPTNQALTAITRHLHPDALAARAATAAHDDAAGHGALTVPLFICTLGFPHQPTFLRIFEPRYRLMLRRCLDSPTPQFGMLMYNPYHEPQGTLGPVRFYHHGTMLAIRHHERLPDGTSLIETVGTWRFRVTAHGVRDGYAVGAVERIDDVSWTEEERLEAAETSSSPSIAPSPSTTTAPPPPTTTTTTDPLAALPTLTLLHQLTAFVTRMQAHSAPWLQQRVLDAHGRPPLHDPALLPYWLASVLPIRDEDKYGLLGTRTVRDRLKIAVGWCRRLEGQRWYQTNPSCLIL